jgi:hypothetical protein
VIHQGENAGKIILDSKNHLRWSNKFTTHIFGAICPSAARARPLSCPAANIAAMNLHLSEIAMAVAPGGRVRLSSDFSETRIAFSIPPERPLPNFAPTWNGAPTDPCRWCATMPKGGSAAWT